jgi:hypothetical protein
MIFTPNGEHREIAAVYFTQNFCNWLYENELTSSKIEIL